MALGDPASERPEDALAVLGGRLAYCLGRLHSGGKRPGLTDRDVDFRSAGRQAFRQCEAPRALRLVRFTLTYEGPLPSRGTAAQKHVIRERLHPQLKQLWSYEPLHGLDKRDRDGNLSSVIIERDGCWFAALVGEGLRVHAELDSLMLRHQSPTAPLIAVGGDIDNRMKTLLDALRAPSVRELSKSQLTIPSTPDDPIYVLMDDDHRVMRSNVDVDRLLAAPTDNTDVKLILRVTTRVQDGVTWANLSLA